MRPLLIVTVIISLLPFKVHSQLSNVVSGEYFFDSDPGVGVATALPAFAANQNIDITFLATSSGLSMGMHVLGIRVKDNNNIWSIPVYIPLYIDRSRTVTKLEYFFDTDPGSGNATTITVSPPTDLLDQIYSMNSSALSLGTHTVNVRVAGQNNFWSIPESVTFNVVVVLPPTITSFTPASGLIGTTVTITGTNFDPVPANNIVEFNGTLATATASTSTDITTTVPAGATTGPITVTVSGNTATSGTNFVVCPVAPTAVPNQGCQNTSIIISASGGASGQYKWYTLASGGTPIAGEINSNYTTPVLSSTTTYYATITAGGCESTRTAVVATVVTTPAPSAVGVSGCPASTFTLIASGGASGQYRWYNVPTGGAAIAGEVNSNYTTSAISTTTTYYVSIVNGGCESSRTPVTATILTTGCAPVITPQPLATQVEGKIVIDLVPLISTVGTLDVNSIKIVTQPTSGAGATITSGVLTIDYSGRLFSGIESISIEACNTNGTCSQQNFSIEVAGDIVVYNAVSPNGDDKNPSLMLEYIDILSSTKNNTVTIYNRWGDEVFSISDYDNKTRVFTGLTTDGTKLPSGIYFYKISLPDAARTVTGFISLKY